ncbi:ParA family protein [Bifidobacterium sp. ESL0784]|uniref:ParA family protein n=1 Tax=Bifidobacterium sp. ESL0784 TaxID=2983231 RepID=UPI0023F78F53|nr:ParA family protein [Bifidobacterium sp. ESL0784]MDF7641471.1 ParA family protein [Bifidobacterium sp. ESL0784]
MRIAIANAKGGVAKTTTAIYLATAVTDRYGETTATVYDADPQSSASLWADAAETDGTGLGFEVRPANLSTLGRLAAQGHGGWDFVDAPPQGRLLEASIRSADFVVIPTSDSPLDLQQAWAMLDEARKTTSAAVLIVRAERNTTAFKQTEQALRDAATPRFDTVIPKRQEIKKALGSRPARTYEYRDLLNELEQVRRDMTGEER